MTQPITRVVVPLGAASETREAIDTAARLAALWHVPLHVVFVEDEELLCLAGLPFACQVSLGAGIEPLTVDCVEEHLRAFADRARRELAVAAERLGVKWSFEVVRGPFGESAIGGAEHDFFVVGWATRAIGSHFRVPSRWWSLMAALAQPFLLAKRKWDTGGSVLALVRHRGSGSARTLDIAAQIAGCRGGALTIAGAPDLAGAQDFAPWVWGLLEGHGLRLQTEVVPTDAAALRQRIVELDCRLMVVEADAKDARADDLRELLEHVSCDVLVLC